MTTRKRLIDGNALKDKLQAHHDFFVNAWGGFGNLPVKDKARVDEISSCIAEVVNAPTVDAIEVVHGHWNISKEGFDECSVCGMACGIAEYDKFCSNCGARMDGGAENGEAD